MSPPLRILHVSEVSTLGVFTLLRDFVEQQAADGHDVHVLAPSALPALPAGTTHAWSLDRSRPWTAPAAWRELRRLVRQLQPDVVHLHSFLAGFLGRLPAGLAGVRDRPVVYQPHSWSDQLSGRAWVNRAIRTSERLSGRRTDLIVANGPDELARARALRIGTPGRSVGVCVDTARLRPPTPEERRRAREELDLPTGHLLLLLGRLTRQKGQDLLLPVWQHRRPADSTLVLLGPGDPDWAAGHAGAEWGRTVLAPGSTDDVRPWLWAADVMVSSSRYEGLAMVVPEAMSAGLPVVATAVDGVREILLGGDGPPAGALVPLGDMGALLDEAGRRLADPELRARESASARDRALRLFSVEVVVGRLVEAYGEAQELRAGKRRR